MSTDATLAYDSHLYYRESGETNYTKVAQTVDLGGPSPEVGEVNITNNDSPDNTKEYIPGMLEPGELEFELVYKKDECAAVYALLGDNTIYEWALKYPDGAGWTFKGFAKGFGTEGETEDGALRNSVTIRVTGKPEFSTALSVSTGGGGS